MTIGFLRFTHIKKLPKQGHVSLTLISLSKNKEKKIMKKKRNKIKNKHAYNLSQLIHQ